jgi:hypothetical protein
MTNEQIKQMYKEFEAGWDFDLDDSENDSPNFTAAWEEHLKANGLLEVITTECNCGEEGYLSTIRRLIEIINACGFVEIVKDPSADGVDFYSHLVFPKTT